MAWSFVNKTDSSPSGTGTTITISVPASVANNDILVAVVAINSDTATLSAPGGWTAGPDVPVTGRSLRIALWWRVASSEPASYDWTVSAAQRRVGAMLAYRGLLTTGQPDASDSSIQDANVTTIDADAVTTSVVNDLIIVAYASNNAGTWTQDSSPAVTERMDRQAAADGNSPTLSVGDFNQATAASTGVITGTMSIVGRHGSITIAFKEITAAPPVDVNATLATLILGGFTASAYSQVVANATLGNLVLSGFTASADAPIAQVANATLATLTLSGFVASAEGNPPIIEFPSPAPVGRRGSIRISSRLYKVTKLNEVLEDITSLTLAGAVEMRTDRPVKKQFKGSLRSPLVVNPYSEYVAPFLRLEYSDGTVIDEQVGLYSFAPPATISTYTTIQADFNAYDLCWNLSQSVYDNAYTVQAATNVVTAVTTILASEGFTRFSIPSTTKVLEFSRTYDMAITKLEIINDLLNSIGYYSLYMKKDGTLASMPYQLLNTTEGSIQLFSGEGSQVVGAIKREPLVEGIFNKVRVIREGAADGRISALRTNSSPYSPVSTVSLGRTIFRDIRLQTLDSTTVAAEIARRALEEAASLYSRYEVSTLPDPRRDVWEVYDCDILMSGGVEALTGKARVTGWDLGFTNRSATMIHHLGRLEDYG